ncbi:hemicentin-1-like [Cyprinodon tularosa]|uniref:hemicentin-1-like n=1 Tax=Cyprinodon tularosa TaxID=77115 RepID=UPI0018E27782|nr:hemicentin-1-like [Cyprinodon tularosa]
MGKKLWALLILCRKYKHFCALLTCEVVFTIQVCQAQVESRGDGIFSRAVLLGKKALASSLHPLLNMKLKRSFQGIRPNIQFAGGYSYSSKTVKCSSSCVLPSQSTYVWYENGQKIGQDKSTFSKDFGSKDSISCAIKGHEDFPAPLLYAPVSPSLSADPSADIFEGSSVTLRCSSEANPPANYTWYKKTQTSTLQLLSRASELLLNKIQSPDSGEYYCEAENQLGKRSNNLNVDVKYAPKPFVVSTSHKEVVELNSLTLTCSSDANPEPSYSWYKDNLMMPVRHGGVFHFPAVRSADSGTYYCRAENKYGWINSSSVHINVEYPPRLPSVSVNPPGEIVVGGSVNLTCSSDANPAATYAWYKENTALSAADGPMLTIVDIRYEHGGNYYCEARNSKGQHNSTLQHIMVSTEPKTPKHKEEEEVEYSVVMVKKTPRQKIDSDKSTISIKSIYLNSISCAVKGHEDFPAPLLYAPVSPSLSADPSADIFEGSSVTLRCSSEANPPANYTWYKKTKTSTLQPLSRGSEFLLNNIQSSDSGEYYCEAENQLGNRRSTNLNVDVKYPPRLPSISVNPPGEIVVGGSVNLTCSSDANPEPSYSWYKDNLMMPVGYGGVFHFPAVRSEDSGTYYCRAENKYGRINSSSVHINVEYPPRLPSVSVNPPGEIVVGGSVNLTCSSDANPAATYGWYKENTASPAADGPMLTIVNIRHEDGGNYYCEARNSRGQHNSTLQLIVGSSSSTAAVAGSITVILLVGLFVFAFILFR